ncbi:hypothetical protein C8F04DRAFT_1178607 [Mycena alexandri]|uniref:Glucose-methanol-choline oxidoreductase C-terminal domain-containing protein n=1 Tax=Mycena alexandri TaxID=1745969 RepID=A0AAD6T652_9AGAR|nr:hypothetical protein C8F04DRAFT_1178607 [Mycena alexandri]
MTIILVLASTHRSDGPLNVSFGIDQVGKEFAEITQRAMKVTLSPINRFSSVPATSKYLLGHSSNHLANAEIDLQRWTQVRCGQTGLPLAWNMFGKRVHESSPQVWHPHCEGPHACRRSAGTMGSPLILERPGLGRKNVLEKAEIPSVTVEILGVGDNNQGFRLSIQPCQYCHHALGVQGRRSAVIEETHTVPIDAPKIVYSAEDDQVIDAYPSQLGTCAMKPLEQGGVGDSKLNVYGVKNLKVADLHIHPVLQCEFEYLLHCHWDWRKGRTQELGSSVEDPRQKRLQPFAELRARTGWTDQDFECQSDHSTEYATSSVQKE